MTSANLIASSAVVLAAVVGSGCASSSHVVEETDLSSSIDSLLADERLENATWGGLVVDLESGETLYRHNERKSFVPASNMKLFTTAAALDQLGTDFVYTTEVFVDGPVEDSVLDGNLIVVGSGDPTIGGRFSDGDLTATFRDWADSLKAAGIFRITGDVVGDDDAFDDIPLGSGWMWDDRSQWYNAEVGALVFNDNCIDLTVEGIAAGDTADVYWEPGQTGYVTVVNQTMTVPRNASPRVAYERQVGNNVIEVSTEVPEGVAVTESVTISNPTRFFAHVLNEILEWEGIEIEGSPRDVDDFFHKPQYDQPGVRRIATYTSPPLSEIAAVVNKPSHNLYAEQVLKTLAIHARLEEDSVDVVAAPPVGTAQRGIEAVMATLARAHVDTTHIRIADGSGLSRYNLITPEMTVTLLSYMWTVPDSSVSNTFIRSLPIAGVDGTIADLITEGPAVGNLKAKTGTMTGIRSLAGYATTTRGRPLVFSFMANNYTVTTSDVNDVLRAVVDLLARL